MSKLRLAVITAVALGAMAMLTLNAMAAGRDEGNKRFTLYEHETNFVSVPPRLTATIQAWSRC